MAEEYQQNVAQGPPVIKKITMPDGFQVGIINLDNILSEIIGLNVTDAETIKKELLNRVKVFNYVPQKAEHEYEADLYHEYQRKLGLIKDEERVEKPGGK
jgi:hypothetical protein